MSIQSEIDRISENVSNALQSVEAKGVSVPEGANSDNLPELINEIFVGYEDAVRYSAQSLNDEQKLQARKNIGAVSETELSSEVTTQLNIAKESGEFDGKDGEDYVLTDADREEIAGMVEENAKDDIVQSIIEELQGLPVFGIVDENKIITVTSQLSSGTYTLKYENADGTLTDVGTITIEGGAVVIVNLLESALTPNDITTVFDGKGYMDGKYASAASPYYNTDAAFFCSGLMPIPASRTFYIKGCTIDTSLSHTRFGLMEEDGSLHNTAKLADWGTGITFTELGEQYYSIKIAEELTTVFYFYFSASGTGEGVIVSATPIE